VLNFGKIRDTNKHVCFDVPDPDPSINIPKITVPKISTPKLPDIPSGILDFGKKLSDNIKNATSELSKLKPPAIPIKKLNFGVPDLTSLDSLVKGIKVPKTICVSVGGDFGVRSMLDQLTEGIKNSTTPKIPIVLPPVPDLTGILPSLSSLIPSINAGQVINVDKSLTQILSETKNRCADFLLNELDNLDPALKLQELINRLKDLCGSLQFSKMQDLINRIQQAKADLVHSALDGITDPLAKLAKLHDMSIDAINTGAQDILEEIGRLADAITFDNMINTLQALDPADAFKMLNAEIKRQSQLKNFDGVKKLLAGVNYLKSVNQTIQDVSDAVLDIPENFIDTLQFKIDELVDLENYDAISKFLALHDMFKDEAISALRNLSPSQILATGSNLLNDALRRLDLGQYNRILDQMASLLCPEGLNVLPNLPNIPGVSPDAIPSFLR
jgi:hypothetical protein